MVSDQAALSASTLPLTLLKKLSLLRQSYAPADKGRPNCQRCISSGHTCGGYELPLRMKVLGVQSEHDGTQRLVKISAPEPSTNLARLPQPRAPDPLELRLLHDHQRTASPYFFAKYGWAPLWRPLILSVTTSGFPEVNKRCFYAISYAYTGIGRGDSAMKARGGRLYGQVLREVQSLLQQPAKPRLAELCSTMILMGMYEVSSAVSGPAPSLGLLNYLQFAMNKVEGSAPPHHVGIINILRHCGPEIFKGDKLLVVYRTCRVLLVSRPGRIM